MLKLETDRLELKPFSKDDSIEIQQLANNIEVASIIGLPHPYLLKFAEEWIDSQPELIEKGIEYPLVIVSKKSEKIVGTITIRIDKSNNKGELGYWIGRDYWGNGFATEAANRMIEFGFEELNLNRIWASAISRNKGSIIVFRESRFTYRRDFKRK